MAYQTKQRSILIAHLRAHAACAFSAKELAATLTEISVSAIYRNLICLEQQGLVQRVSRAGSREACFQYVREGLHLSCEKCGRVYPVESADAQVLLQRIVPAARFAVDPANSVLYGVCAACQDGEGEK